MMHLVSNPRDEKWYTLVVGDDGNLVLEPYTIGKIHVEATKDNVIDGVETINVLASEVVTDIEPRTFLRPVPVLAIVEAEGESRLESTGKEAMYVGHGSAVKEGWLTYVVVKENGEWIPDAIQFVLDAANTAGIVENYYRFGSHFNPYTMWNIKGTAKMMVVPEGTVFVGKDNQRWIAADGNDLFDYAVLNAEGKFKARPWKINPATLAPPNVLSQLDWDEDLAKELLTGFERRSAALNRKSYAAFLGALRFNNRGDEYNGKSILGNIAYAQEIVSVLDKAGVKRDIQGFVSGYPAFVDKMAAALSRDMYRSATTGALRGRYFKVVPAPSLASEEPTIVVGRESDAGKVLVSRQPISDNKSTLAVEAKADDRRDYITQILQYRLGGFKGVAQVHNIAGGKLYLPTGEVMDVPEGVTIILCDNNAKYATEKAMDLCEVYEQDVHIHITEWLRAKDVIAIPCGWVIGEDGVATYHKELNYAKSMNGDFDGDGMSVYWAQEKPLLWNAIHELNQQGLEIPKMTKSKNEIVAADDIEGYISGNSETIFSMVSVSMANFVGRIAVLKERYLNYSRKQRKMIVENGLGMTVDEFERDMAFYHQLSVDVFKYFNPQLVADMEDFIDHVSQVWNSRIDGVGKVEVCHVGKDKNERVVGNGAMWFVNHIPDPSTFAHCGGFIPQMMNRTLAKDDTGEYIIWKGDLPSKAIDGSRAWGVLPNYLFNRWVAIPTDKALKLAQRYIGEYATRFKGISVGFKFVSKDLAKNQWREELGEFKAYILQDAAKKNVSEKAIFEAMFWYYTCGAEQRGDQSLPIVLFPDQFVKMLLDLEMDWDGNYSHPSLVGQTGTQTETLPLLNVTQRWAGYPASPIPEYLNGKTIEVELTTAEHRVGGQSKVVSVVTPLDSTLQQWLTPGGMDLGFTQSTYEGKMKARFEWKPGKTSGGSMMVTYQQ